MDFKVLGCHGGESPKHQCPAFLIDGRVCLDAGSLTNMLTLKEQQKIEAVVVSHAHIDHVRDLAMLADTRAQQGGPPLTVASTPGTIAVLKRHFFNDKLWPDFSKIPDDRNRTIVFQKLKANVVNEVCGYQCAPGDGRSHRRGGGVHDRRRRDHASLQRRHRADRAAVAGDARAAEPERSDHGSRVPQRSGQAGERLRATTRRPASRRNCASSTASSVTCRCCCSTSSRYFSASWSASFRRSARVTTRSCKSATSTCCSRSASRCAALSLCSRKPPG